MNIHIVHLPHTFPYLVNLSLAFNKCGFEEVTLVANGFDYEEILTLQSMTSTYAFINILDIPTKRILSHGQALNYAFEQSQDELFCFADHDIFPTQPIIEDIQSALLEFDVVCLGDRPENTTTDYKGFAASAIASQSGTPLATSFFSVFKRPAVNLANINYKVGFEQYFRKSQIPKILAGHKDIQALKEPFLVDTCKALSLALHLNKNTITHLNTNKVCHFGGLAGAINRFINGGKTIKKEFIAPILPNQKELECHYNKHQQRHPKVLELKRCISDYSLQLVIALQEKTTLPHFKSENQYLNESIAQIKHATQQLFIHK